MELHQLRYFLAVADEGNFTKAAEKCFISQPSLSSQVIKLEEELGERLFNRLGRRAELTEAGRFLERRARVILTEVENAGREIRERTKEVKGVVRVGVTPTAGPYVLPPVIARCRELHPGLEIRVQENLRGALLQRLSDAELEVAIAAYTGNWAHISAEPIHQEPLFLVVPKGHRLESKAALAIEDYKDEPLILLGDSSSLGEKVISIFGSSQAQPNVVAMCSQVSTAKALVDSGFGLSILPRMARADSGQYKIVFKPLLNARMNRLLFALTHEKRYLSVGARAFVEVLRETMDRPEWE